MSPRSAWEYQVSAKAPPEPKNARPNQKAHEFLRNHRLSPFSAACVTRSAASNSASPRLKVTTPNPHSWPIQIRSSTLILNPWRAMITFARSMIFS